MESSSSLLHHSYLTYFNPRKLGKPSFSYPLMPKLRTRKPTRICSSKMYVPGFGEASPEAKAAKHLHDFFTYVAVRIVSAQLEVRSAYCKNDFEWDNLQRLAFKNVDRSNTNHA
ncbi:hypothetical protein HID58_057800 [Brassica napus]|uniref:Uncharacterized protein n=1 Tax=Brassica napus TaxID=3708 RepID=A0ABQ7XFD1_BRANA|nr:hypothetical protein HID58_057800 [Brassica napus]